MKRTHLLIAIILPGVVSACSKQAIKTNTTTNEAAIVEEISLQNALPAPDLFIFKGGEKLKLVRIMEGGACKNKFQGISGMFRLYANPEEVEQIKAKKGPTTFADFERSIEAFSMLAMQRSIDKLTFPTDLSDVDDHAVKQQLAEQFVTLFSGLIADDLTEFERNNALTIDVTPMPDALVIYLQGCSTPHEH